MAAPDYVQKIYHLTKPLMLGTLQACILLRNAWRIFFQFYNEDTRMTPFVNKLASKWTSSYFCPECAEQQLLEASSSQLVGSHVHCVLSKLNSLVGLCCYWLAPAHVTSRLIAIGKRPITGSSGYPVGLWHGLPGSHPYILAKIWHNIYVIIFCN